MPVDYDEAHRLLNETFRRAEQDLLAGRTPAGKPRGNREQVPISGNRISGWPRLPALAAGGDVLRRPPAASAPLAVER